MSKAFTRESNENAREEFVSLRPQLPPGAKNYITRQGANRLQDRLNELLEKRKLEPTTADQNRIDTVIRNVQNTLGSVVIAETPADREKVAFGASVIVRYENGEQEQYRIVGVDEADPANNRISWISPLARALMNRKAGDVVNFQSPAGEQKLTLLKVEYGLE